MIKRILLGLGLLFCASSSFAGVKDSIGTKVKNGKLYILHEVEKGEGLYSISRRYNIPLQVLMKEFGSGDLILGQILEVPTGKNAPFEERVVKNYFAGSKKKPDETASKPQHKPQQAPTPSNDRVTFADYHIVSKGETLYSISKKYNTSVDVLIALNNLSVDPIRVGQKLMVPATEKKSPAVSKPTKIDVSSKTESLPLKSQGYEKTVLTVDKYDIQKVVETGGVKQTKVVDEVINKQNLAYHHEAAVGSILLITNKRNNKAVFVKVVGRCEFDEDKGVMAELTSSAIEKLKYQKGDKVEISYAK